MVVTAVGSPPALDTRNKPVPRADEGENTIRLSRLQLPPQPEGASHSTIGSPPPIWTFFSLPAAKNAINRLSGDQKGKVPPWVPGIGVAVRAPIGRNQIWYVDGPPATNTIFWPSGDTATCVALPV